MSVLVGVSPQVNKFEQVSGDGDLVSLAGGREAEAGRGPIFDIRGRGMVG